MRRIVTTCVAVASVGAATLVATVQAHASVPANEICSIAAEERGTLEGTAEADKYFSESGLGNYKTASTPWSAAFVTWVSLVSGASTMKSASVDAWVSAAANTQKGLSKASSPRRGDLVAFKWDSDSRWDHIGIVISVGDGYYYTIEGDVAGGSLGRDFVTMKRRTPSDAVAVTYIKLAD